LRWFKLVNFCAASHRGHRRNFTLKSGGDQWRRQDLVSGGTTIEAPKVRASTRQRRRVGSGMGRGVPSPADYGVWGASWAPPAGSGAESRPLSHFLHVLGQQRFW